MLKIYHSFIFILLFSQICFSQQKSTKCNDFYKSDTTFIVAIDKSTSLLYFYCTMSKDTEEMYTINITDGKMVFNGPFIDWEKNKIKEQGTFCNGKPCGIMISYYQSEAICNITYYLNDSVIVEKIFFENGNIKSTGTSKLGHEIDVWLYYHDNGILKAKGLYKQLPLTIENASDMRRRSRSPIEILVFPIVSVKDGKWEYYNKDGKLEKVEIYQEGRIIK